MQNYFRFTAKGRQDHANKVIKTICQWNNKPFKEVSKPFDETPPSANLCEMMHYRGLRRNMISMSICWFGFSFGFYGMMYNTPSSQSNVYLGTDLVYAKKRHTFFNRLNPPDNLQ